jgi:hypothetical protein
MVSPISAPSPLQARQGHDVPGEALLHLHPLQALVGVEGGHLGLQDLAFLE